MVVNIKIVEYVTTEGVCPYRAWLIKLDGSVRFRVQARVMRLRDTSNFGTTRDLGQKLFELKFKKIGGGIRIYYGIAGERMVLLILGGNKNSQSVDIKKAREYWHDYLDSKKEV